MSDQRSCKEDCYKVVHGQGDVESVYIVTAFDKRHAKEQIRDQFRDDHNCHTEKCGWSIELFRPDVYFLYSINKATGAMTPFDVSDPKRMCFVCLGQTTS